MSRHLPYILGRVGLAVVIGVSLSQIYFTLTQLPSSSDIEAYWNAALRLREGQPLYVPGETLLAHDVYRYAPWFAVAWVPLTYLPRDMVFTGWTLAMVACVMVAVIPALRLRSLGGLALALLIGWLTLQTALYGNVHPLLIAGLVWTVDRRGGPVWIAVAASLKFVPILYALVYVARREWGRAFTAIALTIVLVAPFAAFDLSGYTSTPGRTISLYAVDPLVWAIVAASAVVIAALLAVRRSRHSWLAASAAVLLAYPQAHLSYASHLLVGTDRSADGDAG